MSGLDFNDDGNVLPEAAIGFAILSGASAANRSAEYQRQQLNLLREHQGLPPVPRQPTFEDDFMWGFRLTIYIAVGLTVLYFAALMLV